MHMEGPGNATGVPIKLFIQPAERERCNIAALPFVPRQSVSHLRLTKQVICTSLSAERTIVISSLHPSDVLGVP
jgi:hypothetical protein